MSLKNSSGGFSSWTLKLFGVSFLYIYSPYQSPTNHMGFHCAGMPRPMSCRAANEKRWPNTKKPSKTVAMMLQERILVGFFAELQGSLWPQQTSQISANHLINYGLKRLNHGFWFLGGVFRLGRDYVCFIPLHLISSQELPPQGYRAQLHVGGRDSGFMT